MPPEPADRGLQSAIRGAQKDEITEYTIYRRLADRERDPKNRDVLERTAAVELAHYQYWQRITGTESGPDRVKVFLYLASARLFGITFTLKLLERDESRIQEVYRGLSVQLPDVARILQDEKQHEGELLALLDEERLRYTGSVVLGLNDALVELTGTLAGLTFALQDTGIIAVAGLITGIAAAFSMAAAEYLSTKSESDGRDPVRAAGYTGIAYILTVLLLIAPYLLLENYFACLAVTITTAILILLFFSYYLSVARDLPFRRRFAEMAGISLGVALLSFLLGIAVRTFLHVDV